MLVDSLPAAGGRLDPPYQTTPIFSQPSRWKTWPLAVQAGLPGGAVELEDQIRRSEQIQQALRAEVEGAVQAQLPDLIARYKTRPKKSGGRAAVRDVGLEIAERVAHQPDHQSALAALARVDEPFACRSPDGRMDRHGPTCWAFTVLPADAKPCSGSEIPALRFEEDRLCVVPD